MAYKISDECTMCGSCKDVCPVEAIRMIDGKDGEFVSFSVGYSILNRTATIDVGSLMLKYGGGGHKAVGTCQVPYEEAEDALNEMIDLIKAAS